MKRLRSSVRSSYKSIAAALLVYDVTSRESFENLREWVEELREECPNEELVLMLTGKYFRTWDEIPVMHSLSHALQSPTDYWSGSPIGGKGRLKSEIQFFNVLVLYFF